MDLTKTSLQSLESSRTNRSIGKNRKTNPKDISIRISCSKKESSEEILMLGYSIKKMMNNIVISSIASLKKLRKS